jgi:hypothetical protein
MAGVASEQASEDFAAHVQAVQAKLAQSVARAGLKDDAYAHVIDAQSAALGVLVEFTQEVRPAAVFADKQVDDIGRRLLGSCQAWSKGLVRASLWRSWAMIGVTVAVVFAAGAGAGWVLTKPASELQCADQSDGSRACWFYTKLPTPPIGRKP